MCEYLAGRVFLLASLYAASTLPESAIVREAVPQQALVRGLLRLWLQNPVLLELQIRERELLKNFGPDHPQVRALGDQIERILDDSVVGRRAKLRTP